MSNSDSQRDFTGAFGQREHLACTAQVSVWPAGPAHGAVSSSGSAHSKWHSNSPSFFLCWSAAVFPCSSSSNYINLSNICCLQWSCLIFGLLLRGLNVTLERTTHTRKVVFASDWCPHAADVCPARAARARLHCNLAQSSPMAPARAALTAPASDWLGNHCSSQRAAVANRAF